MGERWYKTELDSWINQDTPQEALDFIKNGSKLSFKVQGDGNKIIKEPDTSKNLSKVFPLCFIRIDTILVSNTVHR